MEIKILLALLAYGIIIMLGEILSRFTNPFLSRKLAHILCGILTSCLPIFLDLKMTIYLGTILIFIVLITKILNIFKGIELSEKENWGTLYFPIGFLLTAILFWHYNIYCFIFGVLVLGFADPLAALIGKSIGINNYKIFSTKTIEGSSMFFITTLIIYFALIHIHFTYINPLEAKTIVIGIITGAAVTAIEAASFKGTDNILIPALAAAMFSFII